MKKKLLFLIIFALAKSVFGQYDYFEWNKELSLANVNPSLFSGIAVDQYDRVFYIDRNTQKVYWQYGAVEARAPLARSNSNLAYRIDPTGNYLFYISNDNKIVVLKYLYKDLAWTYTTFNSTPVSNYSNIEIGSTVNEVFYVDAATKKISRAFYNSNTNTYGYEVLNTGAVNAQPWSNISYINNCVFYISFESSPNSGKLAGLELITAQNTWQPISISSSKISDYSRILALNKNQVYYVQASDKRIGHYWKTNSGSGYGSFLSTSQPAMTGTPIISIYWNDINYIGTDGNIHCLYWDYSKSDKFLLNNSCSISSPLLAKQGDKLFFLSNDFYLLKPPTKDNFVYRKATKLFVNNELYTPFMINYLAEVYQTITNEDFFVGPSRHYDDDNSNGVGLTQEEIQPLLDLQLQHVADLGFKAVRFNGLNVVPDQYDHDNPNLFFPYTYIDDDNTHNWDYINFEVNDNTINTIFDLYDYVLNRCEKYGLKVNVFLGLANGRSSHTSCHHNYSAYLNKFADRFKDDPRILSYTLILEPDMVDKNYPLIDCKTYIRDITTEWYDTIRAVDKNHLITVALSTSAAFNLFSWDPYIVKCDFLTWHLYASDIKDMTFATQREKLQWISSTMKTLNKPWIIGETSFPGEKVSNNVNGTYDDQRAYGIFIRDNVFSAGASGLTWWNYRDYHWEDDTQGPRGFGLIDEDNTLKTIITPDNIFKNFTPVIGGSYTTDDDTYYRWNYGSKEITGTVYDEATKMPIKDALALLWVDGWKEYYYTYTKSDGQFGLKYNGDHIDQIKFSALNKEVKILWSMQDSSIITLKDFPECTLDFKSDMVLISDDNESSGLRVWPNPTSNILRIEGNKLTGLKVYNSQGIEIHPAISYSNSQTFIDLSQYASGLYHVMCVTELNKKQSFKIIKL